MGTSNDPEARLVKSKLSPLTTAYFSAPKRELNNFPAISHSSNVLRCRLCDSKLEANGTSEVRLDWKHHSLGEGAAVNSNR
jgi:hypothetical protein